MKHIFNGDRVNFQIAGAIRIVHKFNLKFLGTGDKKL